MTNLADREHGRSLTKRQLVMVTGAAVSAMIVPSMIVADQAVWPNGDAAQAIAAAASQDHPGSDVFDPYALAGIAKQMDTPAGRKALASRVRQDFADGATCVVKGWLLSRTEVQLCAATTMRVS
ncbi:hypothetical protein [Actibacterium sp. 188UL27-1]|uniref:hypothetical protein n=1 Tax=Actibacterium sp. 188UL27-1 TaxID=2786961 RepID=UPI001957AC6E|nr:hypothetical protein [Actibacterium sp. 188UL27-1]MBM7069091.1 hypothetical protein [Actibacterium sp. 188UL27-1]